MFPSSVLVVLLVAIGISSGLPSDRIIGGTACSKGYQVSLTITTKDGKKGLCGGSIIAPGYILTAAHCAADASSMLIGFGSPIRSAPLQQANSTQIQVHPKWDSSALVYDCAVVSYDASKVAIDGTNITTIRLPAKSQYSETFSGQMATVSGWGLTQDYTTTPADQLQCLNGSIIPNILCNLAYGGSITDAHICMQGRWQRSTCNGDSGGPLVVNDADGQLTQIGVVSFGLALGCGIGWPGVFARTTSCEDWIVQTANLTQRA